LVANFLAEKTDILQLASGRSGTLLDCRLYQISHI